MLTLPPATTDQLRLSLWLLGAETVRTRSEPSRQRWRLRAEQPDGPWLDLRRAVVPDADAVETQILGGHRALRESLRRVLASVAAERWVALDETGARADRVALLHDLLAVEAQGGPQVEGQRWPDAAQEVTVSLYRASALTRSAARLLIEATWAIWGRASRRSALLQVAGHPLEPITSATLGEELPALSRPALCVEEVRAAWRIAVAWDMRLWLWEQGDERLVAIWETSA